MLEKRVNHRVRDLVVHQIEGEAAHLQVEVNPRFRNSKALAVKQSEIGLSQKMLDPI